MKSEDEFRRAEADAVLRGHDPRRSRPAHWLRLPDGRRYAVGVDSDHPHRSAIGAVEWPPADERALVDALLREWLRSGPLPAEVLEVLLRDTAAALARTLAREETRLPPASPGE